MSDTILTILLSCLGIFALGSVFGFIGGFFRRLRVLKEKINRETETQKQEPKETYNFIIIVSLVTLVVSLIVIIIWSKYTCLYIWIVILVMVIGGHIYSDITTMRKRITPENMHEITEQAGTLKLIRRLLANNQILIATDESPTDLRADFVEST